MVVSSRLSSYASLAAVLCMRARACVRVATHASSAVAVRRIPRGARMLAQMDDGITPRTHQCACRSALQPPRPSKKSYKCQGSRACTCFFVLCAACLFVLVGCLFVCARDAVVVVDCLFARSNVAS
jgi:hypothetical protein